MIKGLMGSFVCWLAPIALAISALSSTASAQTPSANASATEALSRLNAEARTAFTSGDYAQGERVAARVLELTRLSAGETTVQFALALNLQAVMLRALGRPAEADPLIRRALSLYTKLLGEKHPSTIGGIDYLALNLDALGKSAEAESLHRRALSLYTEVLGEKHPDTIASISNLASNLNDLGRSAEAESLYRRALTLATEVLGEKHPDTIAGVNNLASCLTSLGRSAEAEPLYRRALALHTEVLGEKHPNTILSMDNLASSLDELGRSAEAEPLSRRALALRTEVLGEKHRDTINSLTNLGGILAHLGRSAEAEQLFRRTLALRIETLGEKHPSTIDILNNLAVSLDGLGRSSEAEPLHRRAVALNTEVRGDKHPNTITSVINLALNLDATGRSSEAEQLYRRALALRIEVLGEKHVDTINSIHSLAFNLNAQGRPGEAEPLFRRALALRTEVLGEKHPNTIDSLGRMAANLDAMGRSAEAEPLLRRALALRTEVLGGKHPSTIDSLKALAVNLETLGRFGQAEPLYRRALALRTEAIGEKHPDTISSLGDLARILLKVPSGAADAEPFALRAVTLARARAAEFGTSERDAGQHERLTKDSIRYMTLLADADWSAAQARPASLPAFRAEAFSALQDATAGSVTRAVALTAARRAAEASGDAIGALARERQTLSVRWRLNDVAQTAALTGGPGIGERLTTLRSEQTVIEAGIAAADARLRNEAPAYFALIRPAALSVADAQRLLAPDEAVLMVVPTRFGTHVMALTHDGLAWTRTGMTAPEAANAVLTLRRDLDPQAGEPTRAAYDRSAAYALFRATVEPMMGALVGKTYLYVAADGALASLPFGALVASAPTGDDADPVALRATEWLADRFALIQLPSLQSLAFLRQFRARPSEKDATVRFSGFGDPALSGRSQPTSVTALLGVGETATRGGIADVTKLSNLAPLPGTAVELDALRRALGAEESSVHTRAAATEAAVRAADLSHVQVLAFATHGLMAGEGGLAEPALVLTPPKAANIETGEDGLLTASEVTALKLDADWVIMSACNTAAGAGGGEPGLSGLARAFFYAGARSLLASHWRVRDDVAPMLVVEAVRLQRNNPGLSRAQALQRAARAVRNDEADPTLAHPRAWAPFALIGDKG